MMNLRHNQGLEVLLLFQILSSTVNRLKGLMLIMGKFSLTPGNSLSKQMIRPFKNLKTLQLSFKILHLLAKINFNLRLKSKMIQFWRIFHLQKLKLFKEIIKFASLAYNILRVMQSNQIISNQSPQFHPQLCMIQTSKKSSNN